ncbi:MAG: tol-pal system protein YbgF [Desulfobacula sp. GWF2_41_7]|nr:MAG: tol-pal system protein YbgF [Desulfobacula sp. GWF2_41_7]
MKTNCLICIAIGFLLFYGCVEPQQFVALENRVAAMEMEKKKQVNAQTEKDKEFDSIREKMKEGIKPEDYADMKYDIKILKENNQRLQGSIEEINHNLGNYSKKDREDLEKRIERLDNAISQNYEKLVELEKYLGLEPSRTTAPSSPESTGKNAVVAESKPASSAEPGKVDGEQELYASAKNLFDQGDKANARAQFEEFIKKYPKSDNADNARFWIADSYFSEKWFEKAILEYQKVLEDYPKSNKTAAAKLKQGYAFAELGEKANARLILNELLKKHPDSNEAKFAKEKLKSLQ